MENHNAEAEVEAPQAAFAPQPDALQPSLLHVVWRRRWIVFLATAAALAIGFGYLSRATPQYTSTARVYVEKTGPKIITDTEGVMTQAFNYIYTQAELIKSTPILAAALEKPEVRKLKTLRQVTNPVGYLKGALAVDVGKKDEIISVSLECPYPEEGAAIVNAVVDAYVSFHAKRKRTTSGEVLKILQTEKAKRDEELREKLKAMLDFKQENVGLAYESENGNIIIERLARLSDALTGAQMEAIEAQAACQAAEALTDQPARLKHFLTAQRAHGSRNGHYSELDRVRSELASLQLNLDEVRRTVTDDHPAVLALKDKMTRLRERVAELERQCAHAELACLQQRLEAARQKQAQIQNFLDDQRDRAQGLNAKLAQFALLKSDWEQTKKLCDILDDRIKEINVTEDTGALNITILEVAKPSRTPTSPRKTRTMALALVLGLMLGVGGALGRDWMDQRFRSADEIAATLGTPILGVVPAMTTKEGLPAHARKVDADPASHAAEAYRTVRTAIYFGVPDGQAKTLLVTSPAPGDGKTTLASNLGIAMAQAGQRTLIIDADFRKPMQHEVFEVDEEKGLSSVLAGRDPLDDAIQRTSVEGLDLLPCGPVPPNPSEMLNSQAFADTLARLAERYDHILVDSPPVMPVTDARILGAMCDVTLLVLRAEKSHRKVAERARDGLLSVGSRLLGTIVNAVPRAEDRYYYYSSYGYYYRRGYGYGYGYGRRSRERQENEPQAEVTEA
ncbi:MAG: GumC family protein [bacterium]